MAPQFHPILSFPVQELAPEPTASPERQSHILSKWEMKRQGRKGEKESVQARGSVVVGGVGVAVEDGCGRRDDGGGGGSGVGGAAACGAGADGP